MFCPGCGSNQSEDLKFCKSCGTNLLAVRQAVTTNEPTHSKFDWSKTWVAEMFLTQEEQERRKEQLDLLRGITPEMKSQVKRFNEIKGGVITSSVGLALLIFLYVFFKGLIASGDLPNDAAEIVSHIWVVGVIPLFIGIGLIINGMLVSKKLIEISKSQMLFDDPKRALPPVRRTQSDLPFPAPGSSEGSPPKFGVTENTTRELRQD
ncbi:MAG TPA: hypothetical protein VLZ81_08345 [Blastocatellia bacterium]|nr:hypothetical protein [Blastocatellia bacterium]